MLGQDAQDADPTEARLVLGCPREDDPGQVAVLLGEDPEGAVERRLLDHPVHPALVRVRSEHPGVRERGYLGVVDAALLTLAHRAHREAIRPHGRGLIRFEVDPHAERVAHASIAGVLVQVDERQVLGRGVAPELVVWVFLSAALLDRLEQSREGLWLGAPDVQPDVAAMHVDVRVADEAVGALGEQDVPAQLDVWRSPEQEQVGRGEVVRAVEPAGVLVHQLGRRFYVLFARGANRGHAGTSSSRVSGRSVRSVSSRSGLGSGSSPSRLIQTLLRPSSRAGAMSWKRLAATWTCASRSAVVTSKNRSQCAGAGL